MGVAEIQVKVDASCTYLQLLLHKSVTYRRGCRSAVARKCHIL